MTRRFFQNVVVNRLQTQTLRRRTIHDDIDPQNLQIDNTIFKGRSKIQNKLDLDFHGSFQSKESFSLAWNFYVSSVDLWESFYLHWIQWVWRVKDCREGDEHESGDARAQLEPDEVADVVEDSFAFLDGVQDGGEVVV